ncbi:MAG: 16S rRNA (cytosine(1402)-N(4))-methyltransferase RsmH [Candidatus Gracilibacteria bacterium]|nr:16S rRNA (cytosine(1402)-N(4))-methyltransferase RsmH [Candidatus Gracilibacteria bacterium]
MDSTSENNIQKKHVSVLLHELVDAIKVYDSRQNIVVDATLGLAGHANKIIQKLNKGDIFIGFDADIRNLKLAKEILDKVNSDNKVKIILINSNFVNLRSELKKHNIEKITGIYYDLGISSVHVDEADRGFSFKQNGPLDMRFDATKGKTAADIVNSYTEGDLRKIFLEYAEEAACSKIAKKIVEKRKVKKFETTFDLIEALEEVNKHPKTKTRVFQALRIEVNNELEHIKSSINDAINLLEKNGIIFVISFHSLEDRIVKQIFKKETRDCICSDIICSCGHKKSLELLTKKPIIPTEAEIKENPRSRSAKARSAKKII